MLVFIKIFQIEKFLRDVVFSSISSLNIMPSTCRFLINRFLIKKACISKEVGAGGRFGILLDSGTLT